MTGTSQQRVLILLLLWARIVSVPKQPDYLTIIPRGRVGYEMIVANEARSAELAIIISYQISTSGIIVLLKTPTKSR